MRSPEEIQSAKQELAITVDAIKQSLILKEDDSGDLHLILAIAITARVVLEWVAEEGRVSKSFDELVQKLKAHTKAASKASRDVQ